ncbi:unnamed protein product, partial [Didymodactylos carnosus]
MNYSCQIISDNDDCVLLGNLLCSTGFTQNESSFTKSIDNVICTVSIISLSTTEKILVNNDDDFIVYFDLSRPIRSTIDDFLNGNFHQNKCVFLLKSSSENDSDNGDHVLLNKVYVLIKKFNFSLHIVDQDQFSSKLYDLIKDLSYRKYRSRPSNNVSCHRRNFT